MMHRPSVPELLKPGQSYYSLVVAVAKRAREIAQQADEGGVQAQQFVAHPLEFARQTEVGLVAAVDDEVNAVAGIDGVDGGARFVVPALRVADDGKADGIASETLGLDALHVAAVEVRLAADARVVGVILDDVAPDGQPHDSGCGDEGCP